RKELLEIEGIQLFMESVIEESDIEKRVVTEVVKIEQTEIQDALFTVPVDYTQKELLTKEDFNIN
ncbi:DUF4412 domain-containing protein, partial [Bacteroidota bacterium]